MKKLMLAVAVISMAMASQAGYFKWSTGYKQVIDKAGTSTGIAEGTSVYLFDAIGTGNYTQNAILEAFFGSGIDYNKAADSTTINSAAGITAKSTGEYAQDSSHSMYLVLVDGNNIFVSTAIDKSAGATGKSAALAFSTSDASSAAAINWTKDTGFKGAGWYNVPEPTSGLLLLLGVAGLALRRRRA